MNNGTHELAVDSIYTALTQLMKKKPYDEISISEIVKRAGVSRMAYYRNYNAKEEILIKRLQRLLEQFKSSLYQKELDEESFWKVFFETFEQDDNIMYVVDAGLYKQLLDIHLAFTMEYYEKQLKWDMEKEDNKLAMYKKMGNVLGLMIYINKEKCKPAPDKLAKLI